MKNLKTTMPVAGFMLAASGAMAWLLPSPSLTSPLPDATEAAELQETVAFCIKPMTSPIKEEAGLLVDMPLTTQAEFNQCTVLNANNDNYKWEFNTYYSMPRCSSNGDSDDWLFIPVPELEAGKAYKMSIEIRNMSSNVAKKDRFDIRAGRTATLEGMTIEVMPPTVQEIKGKDDSGGPLFNTHEAWIMPEETGTHYVGIHLTTPENDPNFAGWGIYIKNFKVFQGVMASGPDSVTDASAEGFANGQYKATISFKAPTTNTAGETIDALSRIDIVRNDSTVKSFENPEVGASLTFVDSVGSFGDFTWKITPFNAMGEGKSIELEAYVGTRIAKAPGSASFAETGTPGEVTVEWDPVTEDVDGNVLGAGKMFYRIYRVMPNGTGVLAADSLTTTSHTLQAVEAGQQELVSYGVIAVTEAGESAPAQTATEPVGTPYSLPWAESFPDGTISSGIVLGNKPLVGNCMWSISTDASFQNMHSADNDNGYLSFWTTGENDCARLYTGKFKMEGIQKPVVSFYIFKRSNAGVQDLGTIDVEVNDGTGWHTVQTVVAENYPVTGWNKVVVPLTDPYNGKTVQFGFKATKVNYTYQFIDGLSVDSGMEANLSVEDFNIPSKVDCDETFTASVVYANAGLNEARGYKARLLRDGETVAEKECGALASGQTKTTDFEITHDWTTPDVVEYSVEIVYDADEDKSDNITETKSVKTYSGEFPVVTETGGVLYPDAAELSWEAPEFDSTVPAAVTENFESYPSFETEDIGNWRTYDLDKGKIGGASNSDGTPIVLPNAAMNSRQSFWVMDSSHPSINGMSQFLSYSGSKYLAQQYIVGGGQVDDWVVSPEVSATGQTITIMARSFQSGDLETMEVLASPTDRKTSSFTLVKTFENIPADWTRYQVTLPEGTRYFALRCVSVYKFMLFIDDIQYVPAGLSNLAVTGYNVFRDGVKLNDSPVTTTTYTDNALGENPEAAKYAIQTVYNNGLSQLSPEFTVKTSSIGNTVAGIIVSTEYFDLMGCRILKPAKGSVYIERTHCSDGSVRTERKIAK